MGSLEDSDKQAADVQKTPNRVSLDSIKAKIIKEEYTHPVMIPHMTICLLMVSNGFVVLGKSTPADVDNFNEALGKQFAYEDAVRQLWPLEAYLLREKMTS